MEPFQKKEKKKVYAVLYICGLINIVCLVNMISKNIK